MKKKKILVTGAMGFIGMHWVKKLVNEGHVVTGVDIKPLNKYFIKIKNFKFFRASVFDYELLDKLINPILS